MHIPRISLYLVVFVLSACGGGGGDNSPSTQPVVTTNQSPSAVITATPTDGTAPLIVAFDASTSFDPDGVISKYRWDFGDGHSALGKTYSHTYTDVGSHLVELAVTDDKGAVGLATRTIVVRKESASTPAPNQPPVAQIAATPTSGPAPLLVNFNASGSSDPDGTIRQYQWDFGDGALGSGSTISHTFVNTGTYNVQLTVTDNDGETNSATVFVGVNVQVSNVRVQWNNNRESGVHQNGGGYRVYYATRAGFDINGASVVNVPNVSGTTPRSIVITLSPGTYYFKVVAYTALNPTGSEVSQEISVTVQ